jgi:hypothetical protein
MRRDVLAAVSLLVLLLMIMLVLAYYGMERWAPLP